MSERSKDSMVKNISAEDLRAKLANKESGQWYLILDNAILDTLPNKPQFFKASDWEFLLDNTSLAKMRKDSAIVARLSPDSPWIDWFFDGEAADTALLVSTHFSFAELVEHLRKLSSAAVPSSEKTYLFRFYDPRNINRLLNSFTEEELHKFLGPMGEVYWWEREEARGENKLFQIFSPQPSRSALKQPVWPLSQVTIMILSAIREKKWPDELITSLKSSGLSCWIGTLSARASLTFAERAIADAKASGVHSQHLVNLFAELMVKYGYRFDTDPQYPWATLHPKNETPAEKLYRIEAMAAEFEEIALYGLGESDADETGDLWGVAACFWRRLWLVKFDDLSYLDTLSKTLAALERLYPQRFKATELEGLKKHLKRAEDLALQYKLPLIEGRAVLGTIMWLCGSNVWDDDPARPWFANVLKQVVGDDPHERLKWLFTRLKRRVARPYAPYRPTKTEESARTFRRLLRDMYARFHQFGLADMEKLDETDDRNIIGIINYVGQSYLPTVNIELVRRCRAAAVRETRESPSGIFFAKLRPLFGCMFFNFFMVMNLEPPTRLNNQEQVVRWLPQEDLSVLVSDEDKLDYLRQTFTDHLNRACGWLLFDEDLMWLDAADDNIFDSPNDLRVS